MKKVCYDCKKEIVTPRCGGTGYAIDSQHNDRYICYACCAVRDRNDMDKTGRAVLYFTGSPFRWTVGNWPGTLSYPVRHVNEGLHNFTGSRLDFWFTDHVGRRWWGVQYGRNTDIAHCRRLKEG